MADLAGTDDGFRSAPPLTVRRDFWTAASARLDAFALDVGTRQRIEAVLARRVPPLTSAELRELEPLR